MPELRPCPDSPNCAASVGPGALDPIPFDGPVAVARERLATLVREMPRTAIVEQTDDYLRAEIRSAVLGFVDDLELSFDAVGGVVHFRSKSRTGYWDLGVNRRRVETLRRAFVDGD